MNSIRRIFAFLLFIGLLLSNSIKTSEGQIEVPTVTVADIPMNQSPIYKPVEPIEIETVTQEEQVSEEDICLIALVTMAEAEGECEEGKRLVIDTILNRVDHAEFPDTIYEVIYQKDQFSSMWNGRVDRCYVDEDICQLVREELVSRTNTDVIFFTAGEYSKYGTPLFQVENHYFSSYEERKEYDYE